MPDLTTLWATFLKSLYAGTLDVGGAGDALIVRDAANVVAVKNADAAQEFRTYGGYGGFAAIKAASELLTIAAAATTDTAMDLPANAIILAVSVRVTVLIPTAATFTVIGATTSTAFQTGASVAVAAGTTDAGTKACPYLNATAQKVRITPNLSPGDTSGRVRVTVYYLAVTPATS